MRLKLILSFTCCSWAFAQPSRISDNSFLIEEAYNQERGVVQHIVLLDKDWSTKDLGLSFAQEWPLGGQKWQGAYAVNADREFGGFVLEAQIRRQLFLNENIALAPNIFGSLPTGNAEPVTEYEDGGRFGVGFPISIAASSRTTFHLNLSVEYFRMVQNSLFGASESDYVPYGTYSAIAPHLGVSAVQMLAPTMDVMLEFVYDTEWLEEPRFRDEQSAAFLSPGFRHAWNFSSGAQMVGGFGLPIGLTDDVPEVSGLFYLSFEHSFLKQ